MCKKLIYLISFVLVLGLAGSAYAQVGKGNILFEYWFDSTINNNLDTLRAHPDFPDNPHDSEWRTIFEGDVTWNNNYGTRVRGYVYPPQTGEYTFWLATDDDGELHLSTDDNPANATMIAYIEGWAASREWTKFPEQQSNAITLQAGQKYYIEALQSEGGGGDNIAVAWGGPGIGAGPVVIDGMYLSPWIRPEDLMAGNPSPPDGATGVTAPLLSWTAGKTAMWHDVYLGTDPTPPFKARQPLAWAMWFEMGGWTPGVTYYWRIDQVEADNTTIHTGDVWSFTAAPFTAYNPDPADGARFVNPDVDLAWSAGSTATSHDVYFGTDETEVTNGTGGTFKGNQPITGYDPGTLAKDTKYYWRIDEKDNGTVYTGDVWSFRTRPEMVPPDPDMEAWYKLDDEGTGTAIDYSGNDRDGTLIGDPEFVPGYYGDAMEFDGDDHVDTGYTEDLPNWTITCWVTSPAAPSGAAPSGPVHREQNYQFNWNHGSATFRGAAALYAGGAWHAASYSPLEANTWYHLAATYDGNALKAYRNGVLITTNTAPSGAPTENDSLKLGRHAQAAQYFTGTVDDVRVYSRALTDEEIKETMRGEPDLAWNPNPANGSTPDIEGATPLSWTPGEKAAKHDVYFGTDRDAVEDADTTTADIYRGRQDPNTYTPPEGVEINQTYYWRIDEFNTDGTVSEGRVWSFTVANYLIVDDFDSYDDYCNRIFYTWGDGWGHSGDLTCGVQPYNGNGTGSTVGYLSEPYAEQTITHDGSFQSMPMEYLNDGSTGMAHYSETERTFDTPQDWTRHGVKALTLWFRGQPASVGSFNYDPGTGVYTMTAEGYDIWNDYDEFHYAYKRLSGQGEIVARVLSVGNTDPWAKAGIMIRETLDPNSPHAFAFITPDGRRAFQNRPTKGDNMVGTWSAVGAITAPHWVRLVRQGNSFTAYHSSNGTSWEVMPEENTGTDASPNPQTIPMAVDVYVGLALTSHNAGTMCTATFSDVTITGTVVGQWQSQDIGIASNDAERLYVAVEDSTGTAKDVPHSDPNAVQLDTWQEWNIDLADFAPVDLTKVKKIYIGVGNRNTPALGGGGMLYIDDIRLYAPRCYPALVKPAADFNNNCVVDYPDLDIMTDNWLITDYDVTPVAPSNANLVANYKFENNLLDSSVNGNHADPCGAPSYVAGQVGYALEFDGIDDGVATGTILLSDVSEFTLAGWVSAGNPDGSRIGLFGQNDVIEMGFMNGNAEIWTSAAGTTTTPWGFPNNTWHHVAAVANTTSMTIYLDGQLAVVGGGAANYGSSTFTFNIGGGGIWDASGNWFSGQIDEVRVYSRALSQAEIGSLAGKTTTYTQDLYVLLTPQDPAIDMNSDGTIDLKDYALLADTFLDELLWP